MRIIKYTVELDVNKKNILVKEKSQNCPEISNLNEPSKIRDMLNINVTATIKEASIIMNIKLLDHIIIGNDDFQYYSFAENRVVVGQ